MQVYDHMKTNKRSTGEQMCEGAEVLRALGRRNTKEGGDVGAYTYVRLYRRSGVNEVEEHESQQEVKRNLYIHCTSQSHILALVNTTTATRVYIYVYITYITDPTHKWGLLVWVLTQHK